MMRKLVFSICTLIPALQAICQEIRVLDANSAVPIEHVVVFTHTQSSFVQTDSLGNANLAGFGEFTSVTFQHPSYHSLTMTKEELANNSFVVKLVEQIFEIDGVVISANKWEQNPDEVPSRIRSIAPADIELQNPQTSADMLAQTGEIFVQKSQLGGGSPMIRGFSANSILIVIDGVRMNNAIYRSGNLQNVINIDPNFLDGAEVIFGPGSVIYGSDALGGVMDFHTADPELGSKTLIKGKGLLRYASANNENTANFSINIGGKKVGLFAGVTRSTYDDLRAGSDRTSKFPSFGKRLQFVQRINGIDSLLQNDNEDFQRFSGYDQWNALAKLRYKPNSAIDLKYSLHYSTTSNIPRYDRLIELRNGLPRSAEWFYGPQEWLMHAASALLSTKTALFDQAKLTLAYQDYTESRVDRSYQSPLRRERKEGVDVFSANLDFDNSLSNNRQLFYGVEYIYNEVNSTAGMTNIETGISSPASTRYPDGGSTYSSIAGYASYKSPISDIITFSSGIRLSHVQLESVFNDKSFFNFPFNDIAIANTAINGNLGFVYNGPKRTKIDLLFSTGFRAPNIDDVGKVFDSAPGNIVVPNENLKPEYSYNFELGFRRTFGNSLEIQATGFYTMLDNAMVRRDFTFNGQDSLIYDGVLSNVEAIVNTGEAYILGATGRVHIRFEKSVELESNYTLTTGMDRVSNVPLRHVPPAFGRTSINYSKGNGKATFYADYQAKRSFEDLAPSEQNKPHLYTSDGALGWLIFSLKGSYQVVNKLQLDIGIENILDKHYRPYASGISAAGRNFIVALRGNF